MCCLFWITCPSNIKLWLGAQLHSVEQLLDSHAHHPGFLLASVHGVRLATTRLAIHKDSGVKPTDVHSSVNVDSPFIVQLAVDPVKCPTFGRVFLNNVGGVLGCESL
eukprot:GFUD01122450.1.p1 GENE.GFUD01122450.1~~GFUD01122450.1.p1  ORF type:complete len:107 (+),score=9.96 GFUD01122450.1:353-673(+)